MQPQHSNLLYRWIEASDADPLPYGEEPKVYLARLAVVRDYLRRSVYPEIDAAVLMRDGVLLTRHGDDHIETVISRATDLLIDDSNSGRPSFTPYEVYLLLMAIYFHDVGNLLGRSRHEEKIGAILKALEIQLSDDTIERRAILVIAKAHGGNVDGNKKDTISELAERELVRSQEVRIQALAAILRFADELADDSTRSAQALLSTEQVPPQSQVYHHYAKALHSVQIRRSEYLVNLQYLFHACVAKRKFHKGDLSVYLLDEIYGRTLKVFGECEYCMRFTHGIVRIANICVKIEVHTDKHAQHLAIDPITYQIRARGYPQYEKDDIRRHVDDQLITGCDLAKVV